MVRIKKDPSGKGYINRDTGEKLSPKVYIPIVQKFTKIGYSNWINSSRFKVTKKNSMPFSIRTNAERMGGSKEDYEKSRDDVAEWLANRKMSHNAGIEFLDSFPSP